MSAIFDFSSLLTCLLLLIATCTYLRDMRPTIFDSGQTLQPDEAKTKWCDRFFLENEPNRGTTEPLCWRKLFDNGNSLAFFQIKIKLRE
ncbi:LOW QUALITY PROTEIN: hypothetical protein ACHAXA_001620 [Cyclostephanos tholiformis]|uniref:Protein kish n=1 Tax=Cyclostephanos tholiformis TaxID=382380 RepID=A0ABD3RB83_9STRA